MSWDDFFDRYVNNHEEFRFKYKNYIIDLLYSSNGKKFTFYISEYIEKENLFQIIKNRHRFLLSMSFDSPEALLNDFSFENKSFREIWNELEWK